MRMFLTGIVLALLAGADAAWFLWSYLSESGSAVYARFGGVLYALVFILALGAFVCFWVAAFRATRRRFKH